MIRQLQLLIFGIAILVAAFAMQTASAQTLSTWTGATNVYWDNSSNWTTNPYPNNGFPSAGDTYDALIDIDSNVTVDIDIEIENLKLDSAGITFRHSSSGVLQCNQGIDLNAGNFILYGTSPGTFSTAGLLQIPMKWWQQLRRRSNAIPSSQNE